MTNAYSKLSTSDDYEINEDYLDDDSDNESDDECVDDDFDMDVDDFYWY